jgi:hypothetical protein
MRDGCKKTNPTIAPKNDIENKEVGIMKTERPFGRRSLNQHLWVIVPKNPCTKKTLLSEIRESGLDCHGGDNRSRVAKALIQRKKMDNGS